MAQLTVTLQNKTKYHSVENGITLLRALRTLGYDVYSPCGGNGKCGKCKLHVQGEGSVTSCLFIVDRDLELILPDHLESTILTSQYKNTVSLPFDPGNKTSLSAYPMGVAIDIGTTTLVLYLVNLTTGSLIETRSTVNPQTNYGADVITRINYCIQNKEGLVQMQSDVIAEINRQLTHFSHTLGLETTDIVKISVTGNTTMLHFFWGVDPSSLAFVPFKPVFLNEKSASGKELNLACHPEAEIKTLSSVAAYVGSDLAAGIASLEPDSNIHNFLYVDIGTNGEIALVTKKHVFCCATAAGPAFEGANISHGMPAMEGAISVYDDLGCNTIGNVNPRGICGSGLIDVAASLVRNNIIKKDGAMETDFQVAVNQDSGQEILLSRQDVRELQLAKSAIASGLKILLKHAELSFNDIDALYLAGGFGNYVNMESAVTIGLLPSELQNRTIPVGNASGTGAMLALKSSQFTEKVNRLIKKAKYIELSEDEDFVVEFALNMEFRPLEWTSEP